MSTDTHLHCPEQKSPSASDLQPAGKGRKHPDLGITNTSSENKRVPKRPPKIARLRLVLGYLVIIAAFFINDGVFNWWALGFVALGSALRVWSAGTLVKISELCTDGPYAISRNPLYLGTFISGVGLTLFVGSFWLFAFFVATFFLVYRIQIDWEERLLRQEHGDRFDEYCNQAGRYITLKWPGQKIKGSFSFANIIENKELAYQLFWLIMIIGLFSQAYLREAGISITRP